MAKEIERRVADQKGDLAGLPPLGVDKANLNGILARGNGFGKFYVPWIYQPAIDRNHTPILAHRYTGGKPANMEA